MSVPLTREEAPTAAYRKFAQGSQLAQEGQALQAAAMKEVFELHACQGT